MKRVHNFQGSMDDVAPKKDGQSARKRKSAVVPAAVAMKRRGSSKSKSRPTSASSTRDKPVRPSLDTQDYRGSQRLAPGSISCDMSELSLTGNMLYSMDPMSYPGLF